VSPLPGADRDAWIRAIIDTYLESTDYNGLAVHDGFDAGQTMALVGLVEDDLVEVRTTETSMNPHVRRESTTVSRDQQVELMQAGKCERYVLYPTPALLEGHPRITELADQPYEQRLAAGAAVLDIVYFDLDVLENYRNDPRYTFSFWDFGVSFSISDDAYMDPEEAERDKVSAAHVGFAYSGDTRPTGPIRRYLAVFVKDLAAMTPEHQQRWRTYEAARDDIAPHPQWARAQLFGEFPEGPGTFSMCLTEMQYINEISEMLWGEPLFNSTDRPREWGWMIRGSRTDYKTFAHLTDKLLAENLRTRCIPVQPVCLAVSRHIAGAWLAVQHHSAPGEQHQHLVHRATAGPAGPVRDPGRFRLRATRGGVRAKPATPTRPRPVMMCGSG
jgi:hypothetical protein